MAAAVGLAAISTELRFIWSEREVPDNLQILIGDAGYRTLGLFGSMVDTAPELRTALGRDFGLDPAENGILADESRLRRATIARVVDSWGAAKRMTTERDKAAAESKANKAPFTLDRGHHIMLRQRFQTQFGTRLDSAYPCNAMIERRLEEIEEGEPKPDLMTDVISAEAAVDDLVGSVLDKDGVWRTRKSSKSIPLPVDSEDLRARMKLIGISYQIASYKHLSRAWLSTTSPDLWLTHVDYIMSEEVAGLCIRVQDQNVTPPWSTILEYEFQIRKLALKRVVYDGLDISAALEFARKDALTKQWYFETPTSVNASISRKRGAGGGDQGNEQKKGKGRGKAGKGKNAGEKAAEKVAGKGRGKKGGKHKHSHTPDGRMICFRFQTGGCTGKGCTYVHICSNCLGSHSLKDCPTLDTGAAAAA